MRTEQKFQELRESWCGDYIKQNKLDENDSKSWVQAAKAFDGARSENAQDHSVSKHLNFSKNVSPRENFGRLMININGENPNDSEAWKRHFQEFDEIYGGRKFADRHCAASFKKNRPVQKKPTRNKTDLQES